MLKYLKEQFSGNAVYGKGNIVAEVICDSIAKENGVRYTTFRLHYHRFIHSEFMTHRLFSRCASSSRAIPVKKITEQAAINPATPIHWGKNQAGMVADEELDAQVPVTFITDEGEVVEHQATKREAWFLAANEMVRYANAFSNAGYHKQIVNRLLEPWQYMNVVVSATEFQNFFWLREDADAQPEIQELARVMHQAYDQSEPQELSHGEWHLPYIKTERINGKMHYYTMDGEHITLDHARDVSASACAQVSYRNLDTSIEKANKVVERLFKGRKIHGTPAEHQATPMSKTEWQMRMECYEKLSAIQSVHNQFENVLFCGNVRGWIQYRKYFKNEAVYG